MVTCGRLALALAALAAACSRDPPTSGRPTSPPAVPGVETVVAATERLRDVIRTPGTVTPDGSTPEARDARNDLVAAEARLRLAEQQTARLRALAPGDVSPRKDLEAAIAEETSARAAALRARQVLDVLGGASVPPPTDASATWVVARVPQETVPLVGTGATAEFTADLDGHPTFAAIVDAAPAYVDATSRMAPARVRVTDPTHRLLPGMTGTVAIEVGPLHDAVVVPEVAVVYDERRAFVFVDDGHGGFTQTPVRIGVIRDGRVEITDGITAGTRVVTTGAASLLSAARLAASGAD
jgi:hypothetical protein